MCYDINLVVSEDSTVLNFFGRCHYFGHNVVKKHTRH